MESLELRIFNEVAHSKSISKAAENMGYVQSNITAHIKKLENELNTSLFLRHNKGVTLTEDGEKLLEKSEHIISLLDNTVKLFVEPQNLSKSIKIGTTQTIAGYVLPQCLIEYRNNFPNTSISVVIPNHSKMEKQLIKEELDCILTNSLHVFSNAQKIFQIKETLLLITPNSCKSLDDIYNFPVIVNHVESCPYRSALLNWLLLHYATLPNIIELDTVEAIINTVSMGGGISVLPQNTILDNHKINKFYIEDLQTTFISMWISKNKAASEYLSLKNIIEKAIITGFEKER